MSVEEQALCFSCNGSALYGILAMPAQPRSCGVVIVVGGPQYRAGSHRQFVLLARELAAHGYPILRFDYRGMGDSEGETRNFENVEGDIRAAIDLLTEKAPAVEKVVLWGLCDGATAALFYAHQDSRVSGLALVNPWARTEEGEARAYLKHYYQARLTDAELWKKIAGGRFNYIEAGQSLLQLLMRTLQGRTVAGAEDSAPLPDRMLEAFGRFNGRALLILSENDLIAKEFSDLANGSSRWRQLIRLPKVQTFHLRDANHTFSRREWRDVVALQTREWLDGA